MTPDDLLAKFNDLRALPAETEWVEFKEARSNYDFDTLGRYFSALSNEANLKGQSAGWLVFGVSNRLPRKIVGSNFRPQRPSLDSLKNEIARETNHQLTFMEIHELGFPEGRVVLFQIPPAPRCIPTEWRGYAYGRIGESLGILSLQEIEQIRQQVLCEDWSAQTFEEAGVEDLDSKAIEFARQEYKKKHTALAAEVDHWDNLTFLNKAKISISGKITKAAIVLLGKNEAEHLLSPAIARITWVLKDGNGIEKDYNHFGPPLILAVDQVFAKIRNLKYRYLPDASLFPMEITQYDPWVIRETLHNCIAHQDYSQGGRINVVEEAEALIFTNLGDFIPGSVEEAIRRDAPPELYRNRCLADAMVNLNMIDTIGSGIKRMFIKQRQRFFPLPDYDLGEQGRVKVRIMGKVLDEKYTRMIMRMPGLTLFDVIALDKVQKGKRLAEDEYKALKAKRLIEGRRPRIFVSVEVAMATETQEEYIRKRAFDKAHYKKMVISFLEKFGEAKRRQLDNLLLEKISDALTDQQKANWIRNLLQEMRREGLIQRMGSEAGLGAKWVLSKSSRKGNH
jgi:ATP-dependent DNA helicase RecG